MEEINIEIEMQKAAVKAANEADLKWRKENPELAAERDRKALIRYKKFHENVNKQLEKLDKVIMEYKDAIN